MDAFLQARERLRQLEHPPQVTPINTIWEQRAVLFNEKTQLPDGYWCVFGEVLHLCWTQSFRGLALRAEATPDISVGLLWMKEVRRLGLDETLIRQYQHHYPDRRSVQAANIYPNAWLGIFRDWLQRHYLKQAFQAYVHRQRLLQAQTYLNCSRQEAVLKAGTTRLVPLPEACTTSQIWETPGRA